MAASVGVLKNSILLGQVIPSTLTKAVKVQVPYFVYDDLLKAYFKKTQDFVAQDGTNDCKTGDLVIISKLDKTEKREITHCVTERVFRLGDIRDPISGEMVVGTQYRLLYVIYVIRILHLQFTFIIFQERSSGRSQAVWGRQK